MDTKTWRFIAIVNMIGIFLIIIIFVLGMRDGNSCLTNPFIYGADKITTQGPLGTEGVSCQCTFKNPSFNSFSFNEDNVSLHSKITGPISLDDLKGIKLNLTEKEK